MWLEMGSLDFSERKAPEQLPIVLQVLLSQQHRFENHHITIHTEAS